MPCLCFAGVRLEHFCLPGLGTEVSVCMRGREGGGGSRGDITGIAIRKDYAAHYGVFQLVVLGTSHVRVGSCG